MTVLDSGFHPVDAGFRILDSDSSSVDCGFQKGLDSKFFSVLMLFVFESCYIERRCLECMTSLFSFSIYKLYVKKCITVA